MALSLRVRQLLRNLPPNGKHLLLEQLYTNPRRQSFHAQTALHIEMSAVPGTHRAEWIWLTVGDLLEHLGPPPLALARHIHLADPQFYPAWVCWSHGKQCLVHTPEDLAKQQPGYAPTPEGPWPPGYEDDRWPWAPDHKPFAPLGKAYYEKARGIPVYARKTLPLHGYVWATGQLFSVVDQLECSTLIAQGDVERVEQIELAVEHALTGWRFSGQKTLGAWVLAYDAGDVASFMAAPQPSPQQDARPFASIPAPALDRDPRRRGRVKGSGHYVGHELEVIEHVKKLVRHWPTIAAENEQVHTPPRQEDICKATAWGAVPSLIPQPSPSSLYHCLKQYAETIGRPDLSWKDFLLSIHTS